ncbi:MAG: hypothetical protein K2N27_12370 [Ruminococcus sp.]|nr:hypothetical protein [Ruminococcus sp.]
MKKLVLAILSFGFCLSGLFFTIRSIFDKSEKKDENNIVSAMVCMLASQIINIIIRNNNKSKQ